MICPVPLVSYMGVEPKIGVVGKPPYHPFVHRVFHEIHTPSILGVFPLFLETPMYNPFTIDFQRFLLLDFVFRDILIRPKKSESDKWKMDAEATHILQGWAPEIIINSMVVSGSPKRW